MSSATSRPSCLGLDVWKTSFVVYINKWCFVREWVGPKPLSQPMLAYRYLQLWRWQVSVKLESKYNKFHTRIWIMAFQPTVMDLKTSSSKFLPLYPGLHGLNNRIHSELNGEIRYVIPFIALLHRRVGDIFLVETQSLPTGFNFNTLRPQRDGRQFADAFSNAFCEWQCLGLGSTSSEVCPHGSNWQ